MVGFGLVSVDVGLRLGLVEQRSGVMKLCGLVGLGWDIRLLWVVGVEDRRSVGCCLLRGIQPVAVMSWVAGCWEESPELEMRGLANGGVEADMVSVGFRMWLVMADSLSDREVLVMVQGRNAGD